MPKTLLIADDSVVIQKLVGLSFANEEVDLITTDNGEDAIAIIRERKPNLVLADVVMPGKSGYEVCQAIKQDPALQHIPVLLLTGTFEAFDEERAREVAADGHITKPFEAHVLVERANELLNRPAAAPLKAKEEYDFFDDNTGDLAGEIPTGTLEDDLDFSGDLNDAAPVGDLSSPAEPSETADFAGDRTVAVMPADPISVSSLDFDSVAPVTTPAPPEVPTSPPQQESDPGLTVLADFDFDAGDPPPSDETVLADDFSFEAASSPGASSEAPMIGDDLFADIPMASGSASPSDSFDFGASETPSPAAQQASAPGLVSAEPEPATPATLPSPATSEPLEADAVSPEPLTADPLAGPEDFTELEPLGEAPSELQVELESEMGQASPPAPADSVSPVQPVASPVQPEAASPMPDLTPMIRERLHETLEKVAWEAFADISDTIVKQVIDKIENIAWEVIPQMAESMIQEEIRRMKGESE